MWIALPHHKNQKRLDSEPIEVRLPNELEELLHVYIEKALPVLAGEGMDHMFMDLKGKPMLMASKMSFYWSGHLCQGLGISKVFPRNRLRHIFVDERRSRQRVEGPDDEAPRLSWGTQRSGGARAMTSEPCKGSPLMLWKPWGLGGPPCWQDESNLVHQVVCAWI